VTVTETEWWDRIAMAADLLAVRAHPRDLGGRLPPGVSAAVYDQVEDVEALRRLTQLPDETPMDLLVLPFSVYCPEMRSFVSVNDPGTTLEEHLRRLEET
jgi:hypothetical protein